MIADAPPAPPPAIVLPVQVAAREAPQLQGPPAGPQTPPPPPATKPGWRTKLKDKGVTLTFSYVSESAASISGGRDQGAAYTQQLLASAVVDTGKAFGLDGGKFIATIIHRKGEDLTATRLGNLFEVQELFGGGQDLRPAELSYEQQLNGGKTALKIGLYHTGDDFATLPSGCQFQNFAFCPRPTTLFYNSGFSGFPIPRWGVRARQDIGGGLSVTVAAFEVNSIRAQTGNGWQLAPRFDSLVVPVELGWKSGQKEGGLPGLVRIGGLVDTTDRADVRDDINGDSYVLSGLSPAMRQERWSAWVMAEKMIARFGPGDRGLSLFGTATLSDSHTARVPIFLSGGFVARGLWDSRPKDNFGLGLVYARVNPRISDRQRDQQSLGQAVDVQTWEASGEIFYGWQATRELLLRPNLQYIHRVGATSRYADAVVAGLTVKLIL
ncbi:carbohydrate porin [Sphingobium lactosutens]|uniref:carbohydrate porin n=1 Tax=Sphingobium lactosutens TaxID=522773 RepID=UPI0015BF9CC0|nr:carbohydrate porin [Sphingobium lactosutens]NWK94605.1 carbohydrate porin [Sphingobium lactosutens]